MTGSKKRSGGPHHHFFVGCLVAYLGLVPGVAPAHAAIAVAALLLSAAAFLALASCPGDLTSVVFAKANLAAAVLRRKRRSIRQRVETLANCRFGAAIEKSIATYVEVLVVHCLILVMVHD
jgi:hypothetical protein